MTRNVIETLHDRRFTLTRLPKPWGHKASGLGETPMHSTRSVLGKCVYLVTLAMSLFDLQDVCIAIRSTATLDLPMVVDMIGIYGLKGPYSGQITHCPSYTFRIDLNKACDHNQLSSACYYQLTSEQYHKTTQAKYSPPEHSAQDIQNTPKLNPAKTPVCIHYTTQCLPELLTPKWFYPETTHDTTSITPYCIVQLRTVPH
ncbi:copper transporter 1-like [Dorcoceras hygrometricum]|uniref:Copper transporter 1-like n=1 Tax=Dorcoceras hygrometricum TaxID=472368 RepID=A0A2Z7B8M4_9LAMI|nr:copper transporter 1-like [Dorcoceras hygrometricum]